MAFLRARRGRIKLRAESDRHHALDAAVVAACSHGMAKRMADYPRRKGWRTCETAFQIFRPVWLRRVSIKKTSRLAERDGLFWFVWQRVAIRLPP